MARGGGTPAVWQKRCASPSAEDRPVIHKRKAINSQCAG
eukprot:CAMPEP_0203966690 /NCGR_PEP_ID=MMETSP0359-20131031/95854_1 /ASSEMBLY_ACC=CAM_ASM_000338 /TAXON_ID=268821 /ORGANISM="Scrippsiella Hangoei, Strain SHTV-5" /LENGTH=38 /DNA_ID= /DNA_START= /DNA_END= /DNA_ORIENTATION=